MSANLAPIALLLAQSAAAQEYFNPSTSSGFGGSYNVGSSSASDSDSSGSSAGAIFGASISLGYNVAHVARMFAIHGILAAIAFAFLFPFGAILIRVVPGRFSVWIHAAAQIVSYSLFLAAFVIGIYYTRRMTYGEFNLLENHHPIIGIIVFALLGTQPITGLVHHARFKAVGGRTVVSYVHLWVGRIGIALGMINGGLGLVLAGASQDWRIAYGVVAGVMGLFWILAALWGNIKRSRGSIHPAERHRSSLGSRSVGGSPYGQKDVYTKRESQSGSQVGSRAASQAKSKSSRSSKSTSKASKK